MKTNNFKSKEFLELEIISPLEQRKIDGGYEYGGYEYGYRHQQKKQQKKWGKTVVTIEQQNLLYIYIPGGSWYDKISIKI